MNVIYFHSLYIQIFQLGNFHFRRILGVAGGPEHAPFYNEVRAGTHCIEIIERHLLQLYTTLYARIRFTEEICGSIYTAAPGFKDCCIQMERRWVDLIRQVDVADIDCLEVQMTQDKGSFRVLIDIGDSGVIDFQTVYFEWVDILYCLLPAALLE